MCTLVFDDQCPLYFLHLCQSDLQVLGLSLQVDLVYLLQLLLSADEAQKPANFLVSDLESFLRFHEPMDFLFEPSSFVEVVIDGCFVGLEGAVLEIFGLFLGLFVFLGDSVLFSGELVGLLFELAYFGGKGFGLLHSLAE
jgi:hypothetical protein